jgi:hypothetical protein
MKTFIAGLVDIIEDNYYGVKFLRKVLLIKSRSSAHPHALREILGNGFLTLPPNGNNYHCHYSYPLFRAVECRVKC